MKVARAVFQVGVVAAATTAFGFAVGNYHIDHDQDVEHVVQSALWFAGWLLALSLVTLIASVVALGLYMLSLHNAGDDAAQPLREAGAETDEDDSVVHI